jgi:hypothetical protein
MYFGGSIPESLPTVAEPLHPVGYQSAREAATLPSP